MDIHQKIITITVRKQHAAQDPLPLPLPQACCLTAQTRTVMMMMMFLDEDETEHVVVSNSRSLFGGLRWRVRANLLSESEAVNMMTGCDDISQ